MTRRAGLVLSCSLVLVLTQPFVPIRQFVLRADDAFYYFGVAAHFPTLGFWSFDSIHTTNGVQPLWAAILTALAQVLSWLGVTGLGTLARVFVALAVLLLFASTMVLFDLLRRTVSVGTGLAAAGAFVFPLGAVWARAWGMENSLYALLLVSTVAYFHFVARVRQDRASAAILGGLLGLTVLARLNAATLVPCLLLFFLLRGPSAGRRGRLRLVVVAGCAAVLVTLPYFAANYAITGHATPISGTVKSIDTRDYLSQRHISSRLSTSFVSDVYHDYGSNISWFLRSRAGDGLWIVGDQAITTNAPGWAWLGAALGFFGLAPLLLGRPREWARFLGTRLRCLRPFAYFLVFAVLDAAISIALYPTELAYAMVRWWFVPQEIVIVVCVSTFVVASLSYMGSRLLAGRWRLSIATVGLAALLLFQGQQVFRFYWSDTIQYRDWNQSFNDEMYRAAGWLRTHAPPNALIGSWNAGVLGYYARQRVEDLDGLVNGYAVVPYLRSGRTVALIEHERLNYLADISGEFTRRHPDVLRKLRLQKVYSHYSAFAHRDYLIYKVLGPV
jgi:hypothetical protein